MEQNPGDSSSESDISDPWSIIDRDSCEPEEIPTENARDRDSVSGEPSDGESLEVIDEEEKHEDYKDADMETDGMSVITESEINEELEHPLSLSGSKEKKYLHHPNTYLNTRLNVLLAISLAAVTGLGVGHFIGLQEECPLLNESTQATLIKLQEDNEFLRNEIAKLLNENAVTSHACKEMQNWEYGPGLNLKSSDISQLLDSSEVDAEREPRTWEYTFPSDLQAQENTRDPQDVPNNDHSLEAAAAAVQASSEESTSKSETSDYLILAQHGGTPEPLGETASKVTNNIIDSVIDHIEDVLPTARLVQDEKSAVELSSPTIEREGQEASSMDDKWTAEESIIVEDPLILHMDGLKSFSLTNEDLPSEDKKPLASVILDNVPQQKIERDVPENILESIREPFNWEESSMGIIKSTLRLLHRQFDGDIVSPDTGGILSSAVKLADDLEQSWVRLQNAINECEAMKSESCTQLRKRMKTAVSKLRDSTEDLAEDIDEQMYKLLTKIVRKLQKSKGNLQEKWCNIRHKYQTEKGAVYDLFHGPVLLECNEGSKQKRSNQFYSKGTLRVQENVVHSTADNMGKTIPADITQHDYNNNNNNFKIQDPITASEQADGEVIVNHDKLHEQHLRTDTPVIVPESPAYDTGKESYNDRKRDSFGTLKKEKEGHYNGHKYHSETCWQTHDGKPVCQKAKHKHQKLKDQFVKRGRGDNYWYEKKNWKNRYDNKKTKESKKHETKQKWHDGNKYFQKQSVILEQGSSWIMADAADMATQNNVTGDWMSKMANARAEQRRLAHRSDWYFDRADARKLKRERPHVTGNWYFQRARGREYCRYYPRSDWCKMEGYDDWPHQHESARTRQQDRWFKKHVVRPFASAGRWMKDSFSHFQNKVNYHSHR